MRNGSITDGSLCNSAKHANQAALLWKSPPLPLSLSLFVSLSGYDRYSNLGADSFFSTPIPRIDETLVNLHPSRCVRGRWFEGHINSRAACFSLHARTHTHIYMRIVTMFPIPLFATARSTRPFFTSPAPDLEKS